MLIVSFPVAVLVWLACPGVTPLAKVVHRVGAAACRSGSLRPMCKVAHASAADAALCPKAYLLAVGVPRVTATQVVQATEN